MKDLIDLALVDTVPEMMILSMSPRADCDHSEQEITEGMTHYCLICGEHWYVL